MLTDSQHINFSPDNLFILNACLALIMFGVSLNIHVSHFTQLIGQKKAIFTGLFSQLILLPAITCLLAATLPISTGIAMGMILVAACPGGNVSNFFSMLAGGNVALSVTLTAISSVLAFIVTPLSFFFWASLIPSLSAEMRTLEVNFFQLLENMLLILFLPLVVGMWIAHKFEAFAEKIGKPIRILSMLILTGFITMAFAKNSEAFSINIASIFWVVLFHNGLALLVPYFFSRWLGNSETVNRTVAIETGIQNSGLGLVIIFTFFNGNFSMALVAAWWGIWHLLAGFSFAAFFRIKSHFTKIPV